jgi:hypothetical protein
MPLQFVQVRFYSGNTRRFPISKEEIKKKGYPDVPTYLYATGQVKGWCEEVSEKEIQTELLAEKESLECQRKARILGGKNDYWR